MKFETRQEFEAWASMRALDLKPERCTAGDFQYSEWNADFAWQAWKHQAERMEGLRRRLDSLERDNQLLRATAAEAIAMDLSESHAILDMRRDAERYRYVREFPLVLCPNDGGNVRRRHELDVLVDRYRLASCMQPAGK